MNLLRTSVALSAILVAGAALAQDGAITVWADATAPAGRRGVHRRPSGSSGEPRRSTMARRAPRAPSRPRSASPTRPMKAGRTWCSRPRTTTPPGPPRETNGVQAFAQVLNEGFLDQAFLDGFTPARSTR